MSAMPLAKKGICPKLLKSTHPQRKLHPRAEMCPFRTRDVEGGGESPWPCGEQKSMCILSTLVRAACGIAVRYLVGHGGYPLWYPHRAPLAAIALP